MIERYLIHGQDRHGVVRHARRLAAATGTPVARTVAELPAGAVVHLDLTDRLLAPRSADAPAAAARLFDDLDERRCRVVLGLHDIPGGSRQAWSSSRLGLYRQLADRVDALVVCSDVEADLLRAQGIASDAVIPLPVPEGAPAAAASRFGSVTVLGFIWPGRGHLDVLAALPAELPLQCVGGPAPGHDDLAATLTADPRVHVTGYVPDAEVAALLTADTIPVAPNRALNASASICDWWSHRRRPLVPRTRHTRELLARNPGSLLLYDDLAAALATAVADPRMTYLPAGVRPGPDVATAAATRLGVGR